MARLHVYTNFVCSQFTDGIWGSSPDNPCERSYIPQPGLFQAFSNGMVPLRTVAGDQPLYPLGDPRQVCVNYYSGVIPPADINTIFDDDRKTSGSFKAFKEARKDGKVVLKPRFVRKITLTRNPGTHILEPSPYPLVVRQRALSDWGIQTSLAWNSCSWGSTSSRVISVGGYPTTGVLITGNTLPGMAFHYWKRYDVDGLYLPPTDPGFEALDQVLKALAAPRDSGLITGAIAAANSGTFDLLTELGEMKETIGYIFGLLRSIVELAVKIRKTAFGISKQPGKAATTIADELSSLWMQFRYAVMPITYSIDDALETLASLAGEYQSFRQGQSKTHEIRLSNGWSCTDLVTIDRVFVKYRYDLSAKFRGMKMNPFATAWELTPLSFVVDWALNIGDMLSALWTPSEVIDSGFQYSRQVRETTLMLTHPTFTGNLELKIGFYEANPFTPIDHIGLNFDLNLTWKRWLDALSLSWGYTKGLIKTK